MRFFIFFLLVSLSAIAQADVKVSGAWIKNLPPAVPVRAGYMNLENTGSQPMALVGASSERFMMVEIHRSLMVDGVMKMEAQDRIVIEPGSTVTLEPGGLHLMLMQPTEPTTPGETIDLMLNFEDGSTQTVTLEVKK